MATSEIEEKTERLQDLLTAENLGGVLLNAQHNFAWLTGGRSNGIDLSRENGASFLLIRRDGRRFVLSNNIEMPRLVAEELDLNQFEPVEIPWQEEKASSVVLDRSRSLLTDGELVTDIPLFGQVRSIEPQIAACRYELTADELERFRELGRDAGRAIGDVIGKIAPGLTEIDVARRVRDELAGNGIYAVVTLVGSDERIERFRHPVPTEKVWKNTLLIAVCAKRHGLIVSLSRIVSTGGISAELQRRTEAAAFVNARLYAATRAGASGAELYKVASDAYAEQGFRDEIDKHHQGGAAGYKTREWVAHPKSAEIVRANQAFAWNPSITGTKAEETGIVAANGFEVITSTPDFPQLVTIVDGVEYHSPRILSL